MPRAVITLLLVSALGSSLAGQSQLPAKGTTDPFLTGAPFTFDQVLKLAAESVIPLHRRKQAIQNRGVDFTPSPEQIDKLKSAGAPNDLLKLIRSKKPDAAPTHPAPKSDPLGSVAVTCAPMECEISLNGTPLGSTAGGHLEMAKLRPGSWAIDFKKDGYISQQSIAKVEAGHSLPVSVTLEPDRATQETFGAKLFEKVVNALGGAEALQELASVQATGSTTIATPNGKSVRWTLVMRNRPDRALFQLRAGGGLLHEVSFLGSEFKTSKNLKGQEALDLPTGFGLIRDNQLSALIARLRNPQFKMLANHSGPVDGEEYTLFAEDGAEKVAIGLDAELRPQRVRITTAAGVGAAVITYSDYCKNENAVYPKTIEIKPDGWQQGIDVRFDTVDLSPKLSDNDYKLRGKPLPNLAR
ncbi:MAG TPA: hypothetical protein VGV35_06710 [Bryobacteraceae bacterium]|nr:hypothetical protein [Bryobacteraceae bacterium]